MEIKILKFGGDSLSTTSSQINVSKIIKKENKKTIIVCSAMGKSGFPYSTDNLKLLVEDKYITDKELARLIGLGEIISSIRLSYIFNKEGIKSYALSLNELGFIANSNYLNADIINHNIDYISALLKEFDSIICPGFIAKNIKNEAVVLGRNGSDYSALMIAKSMNIKEVALIKNVDGIYHTKPSIYKKSKIYKYISYDEMLSLNDIGFTIVQKKAVEEAKLNNISIIVKSFDLENDNQSIISQTPSNEKILGYNIIDKKIYIATLFPCEIKQILEKEFIKHHIFINEDEINSNYYSFIVSKSVQNIIKNILNTLISLQN